MKYISLAAGALGVLVLFVTAFGRFIGITENFVIGLLGEAHRTGILISHVNTLLLIGIFAHLLGTKQK